MALRCVVGAIMKRRSKEFGDDLLTIKVDWVEGLDRSFVQVQGVPGGGGGGVGSQRRHPALVHQQVQLEQLAKSSAPSRMTSRRVSHPRVDAHVQLRGVDARRVSSAVHVDVAGQQRQRRRRPYTLRDVQRHDARERGGYGPGGAAGRVSAAVPAAKRVRSAVQIPRATAAASPSRRARARAENVRRRQARATNKVWSNSIGCNRVEKPRRAPPSASSRTSPLRAVARQKMSRLSSTSQALSTKLDSMMSFHKLQLDVSGVR